VSEMQEYKKLKEFWRRSQLGINDDVTKYNGAGVSKSCPTIGEYATWRFFDTRTVDPEPYVYHHLVPQIICPFGEIAPMLKSLTEVTLPRTWEDLYAHVRIGDCGNIRPRFMSAPSIETIGQQRAVPPHDGIVGRFDLLLWTFWDRIRYGGYARSGGRRGPLSNKDRAVHGGIGRYRAGAAHEWTVISTLNGIIFGFVAYDERGEPAPYWNIAPCPIDDLIDQMGVSERIDTLANL
jgi:hypothetical protein